LTNLNKKQIKFVPIITIIFRCDKTHSFSSGKSF